MGYTPKLMLDVRETEEFSDWLSALSDLRAKSEDARQDRAACGW
jgi:putative component of toxin-antitoxin plasmid stabilization module